MSKKTNSLIFMLLATLLNLLLLIVFFFVGMLLVGLYANYNPDSGIIPMLFVVVFLVAIVGSFLIYSKIIKVVNKKFSLEDKLDPIFGKKNHKVKREE